MKIKTFGIAVGIALAAASVQAGPIKKMSPGMYRQLANPKIAGGSFYGERIIFVDEKNNVIGAIEWAEGLVKMQGNYDGSTAIFFQTYVQAYIDAYMDARGKFTVQPSTDAIPTPASAPTPEEKK